MRHTEPFPARLDHIAFVKAVDRQKQNRGIDEKQYKSNQKPFENTFKFYHKEVPLVSVIIPQILPGIISGFLLAITLSLDDYVITAYTKPDSFKTISTHIYGLSKNNLTGPTIKAAYWAFTAIIFFLIVIVVISANVISHKKIRSKKR